MLGYTHYILAPFWSLLFPGYGGLFKPRIFNEAGRKQRWRSCCCWAAVLSWGTVPRHDFLFSLFWNSHQGICLWVEAILNPGSGGWWRRWWWWGTFPREANWAQSGVLKANPNKQCWRVSWRYCHACLHHRHQIVRGIRLSNPRAKTSPVILHESQSHYQRKVNVSGKALMPWQMRLLCSLQAAQTLMELH